MPLRVGKIAARLCPRGWFGAGDFAHPTVYGPEPLMGEVSLIDVSKRFSLRVGGQPQTVQALSRVSFTVRDGEIVSLIGPSGCGKTTALRVAMGPETPAGRRGLVDGPEGKGCGPPPGLGFQHAD